MPYLDPGDYGIPALRPNPHDSLDGIDPLQVLIAQRAAAAQPVQHPAGWSQPAAVPVQSQWVNEAAQNYARQRLAQAAKAGLLHPSTAMLQGDPAQIWRNVSVQIAQQAAQHGYRDAGHWLDLGAPGVHGTPHPGNRPGLLQHLARRQAGVGRWVRA